MNSPDQRASDAARQAAIQTVREALASGRIIQADHDIRVDQIRNARTMQDIDLQLRDLVMRSAGPSATFGAGAAAVFSAGNDAAFLGHQHDAPQVNPQAAQPSVQPAAQPPAGQFPTVNYGPPTAASVDPSEALAQLAERATAATSRKSVRGVIGLAILGAVIVPIVGSIIAFTASMKSFTVPDFGLDEPVDQETYLPGEPPSDEGVNVHTKAGYRALVDALRDETGSTYVFRAVLYPDYAILDVPAGQDNRYQSYYWNGRELSAQTIKGARQEPQFDLSLVKPRQIIRMLDTVRGRMDDARSWYVIIGGAFGDVGTTISAYASSEFSESTYVIQTLDGTVVYDSEEHK